MCGIAGCVAPAGAPPDRGALERMAASLRHRGPDDQGIEVFENVGLVSTRLAIVDPSPAGHQPMPDPDGRWLVAYNGEIYNHQALRAELPADGWRGHSDTETLVRALAEWGESAVERCNGPLAVAAVDRSRRRLLLVRDRFGKKPLYVARHDGALWFASEIKALHAAGVPGRLRREILEHTAFRGWASGRATPLDGVDRVLPGTLVTVSLDTLSASERRWHDQAIAVDPDLARELESLPRREQADRLEAALRRGGAPAPDVRRPGRDDVLGWPRLLAGHGASARRARVSHGVQLLADPRSRKPTRVPRVRRPRRPLAWTLRRSR